MNTRNSKRSICYARVSTATQADSGLGIAAQLEKCQAYATAYDYQPTETIIDDGVSGSVAPVNRPGLAGALEALDQGEADILIAASLSRLGRKTADVLEIADRAERNGWGLVVLDLNLDTSTPTGRFTLTVLAGVAELEREQTRQRTRDALKALKAQGARLGRPVSERTRTAGQRANVLRESGLSWRKIAAQLDSEGYSRRSSTAPWTAAAASRAAQSIALDKQAEANRV